MNVKDYINADKSMDVARWIKDMKNASIKESSKEIDDFAFTTFFLALEFGWGVDENKYVVSFLKAGFSEEEILNQRIMEMNRPKEPEEYKNKSIPADWVVIVMNEESGKNYNDLSKRREVRILKNLTLKQLYDHPKTYLNTGHATGMLRDWDEKTQKLSGYVVLGSCHPHLRVKNKL